MINFASLFNQFRSNSNSAISDMLQQPNVDLPKLLDEDSFINQYKSGNNKLMEYMKYDKFATLVQYITVVGPVDDRRRSYKFPLSASDILSSENNSAVDYFLPDGKLTIDYITYEEQQIEVQVEDNSPAEQPESQDKNEVDVSVEETPKTIIQDNLEQPGEQPVQGQSKKVEPAQKTTEIQQEDKKIQVEDQQKEQENNAQQIKEPIETTKKTKMAKQIRKIEKINKIEVTPLINQLFSYFQGEVNYTLAGYVCKVMLMLLNKKPNALLKFILENQKNRKALLNHIESRSVCEFITRVLTLENTDFIDERIILFKEMIAKLGNNAEIFVLSNLSACVCQTIEKCITQLKTTNPIKQFSTMFFNPTEISCIINNVISETENVSVYNAPILYIYLTNVPLNAPENQQLLKNFQTMLQGFVEKAERKLRVTKEQRKALGFGRVKILEILCFILKENILNAREVVAKKDTFFGVLFELCRNYQMNNVLHNQVVKIIDIALALDENSAFLKSLIDNDVLLTFLIKQYKEDCLIKAGQGKRKTRKGYIGHIVQICQKIKEHSANTEILTHLTEKVEFQEIMQNLVEKETFQTNKNLAGYSMRKNLPQKILFQKEQVIAQYINFLSKRFEPIYQAQPQLIDIPHPDLIDELKRQLEQNLEIKDQQKPQEKQQEERANPKYWVMHIEYDIEKLMSQM